MRVDVSRYTFNSDNLSFKKTPTTPNLLNILRRSAENFSDPKILEMKHKTPTKSSSDIKDFVIRYASMAGLALAFALGTASLGAFAGKQMSKNHISISDLISLTKTTLKKVL